MATTKQYDVYYHRGKPDEKRQQIEVETFESIEELTASATEDTLKLTNRAIVTEAMNKCRAGMRPADPKAQYNRAKSEIVEKMLSGDLSQDDAMAQLQEAKSVFEAGGAEVAEASSEEDDD